MLTGEDEDPDLELDKNQTIPADLGKDWYIFLTINGILIFKLFKLKLNSKLQIIFNYLLITMVDVMHLR